MVLRFYWREPKYTQYGRRCFFYYGHLIDYDYIMDDFGNAVYTDLISIYDNNWEPA